MTKNFIDFEKCNLVTRSYWIIHGITKLPKCERDECVCSVGMNSNVNFKQGYAPFCTTSCALKAYNATIKKEYRKNYINRKSPKRPVSSKLDEILHQTWTQLFLCHLASCLQLLALSLGAYLWTQMNLCNHTLFADHLLSLHIDCSNSRILNQTSTQLAFAIQFLLLHRSQFSVCS